MLVLSRKQEQIVDIDVGPSDQNTHVEVLVIEIRGDKVRLGFKAPNSAVIHRREVTLAIGREMEEMQRQRIAAESVVESKSEASA
jgi:carbon storage regulator CsrA